MNWDDIKIVLAISRACTQSAAADILGIDQSTVGRRLTALEGSLGTVLFVRSKSGFRPTETGERIIARAQSIETEMLWLEDDAQAGTDDLHGPVTIVGNHWTLNRIIRAGLNDMLVATPGLEVRFVSGSNHWPLTQGSPVLALWFEIEPHDAEFAFPIAQVPYAVYLKESLDPDGANWVTFQDPKSKRAPDRWLNKNTQTDVSPILTGNDAGLLLTAVQSGIGKALLPCCLADHAAGIKRLPSKRPALVRTLYIHANADLVQTRRMQCIIDWLRTNAQDAFMAP